MQKQKTKGFSSRAYIVAFLLILVLYVVLVFTLPPDPKTLSKYNFSASDVKLLNLTVVLPLIAIYLTALYGFIRFNGYVKKVYSTKEGPALQNLSYGLMILAFGLPINSVVSSLNNYIRFEIPQIAPQTQILKNYIALLIAFTAFFFLAKGAQRLSLTLRKKPINTIPFLNLILPITLASFFTWIILDVGSSSADTGNYLLPDWLLISTIIVPYTYVWCLGIRATIQLKNYRSEVKGKLYKYALKNFTHGIGVLIVISIFIQFLTSLPEQLSRLSLTPLLLVVYLLILAYAVGYGLVARGAKHLRKIEEV